MAERRWAEAEQDQSEEPPALGEALARLAALEALVRALHDMFKAALEDPAHLSVLDRLDMPVIYKNTADYTAFVRQQYEEDKAMIQKLGLRL